VLKNGKNIMPQEIEALLLRRPIFKEVVVKEEPAEDAGGAEALMAVVYPDPELAAGLSAEALRAAVQEEIDAVNKDLIYYKKIRAFCLRDTEFEKTTTKKIKRFMV